MPHAMAQHTRLFSASTMPTSSPSRETTSAPRASAGKASTPSSSACGNCISCSGMEGGLRGGEGEPCEAQVARAPIEDHVEAERRSIRDAVQDVILARQRDQHVLEAII